MACKQSRSRAAASCAVVVGIVAAWTLSIQVAGPGQGIALADTTVGARFLNNLIEDPDNAGTYVGPDGSIITFDATEAVAAEAGVISCPETVGAGCVAAGLIVGAGVVGAAWHFLWGSSHPTPGGDGPSHELVDGYGLSSPYDCDVTGYQCVDVYAPDGTSAGSMGVEIQQSDGSAASYGISGTGPPWTIHAEDGFEGICEEGPTGVRGSVVAAEGDLSRLSWPCGGIDDPDPGDPDTHNVTAHLTCSDGTSSDTSTGSFSGNDAIPPLPIPSCGAGAAPTSLTFGDTDTGTNAVPSGTWTAPTDPDQSYTDCGPGGADVPCIMRWQEVVLPTGTVVHATSTENWLDCTSDGVDCSSLSTHPSGKIEVDTDPSTDGDSDYYRCEWGPDNVPLDDCDAGSAPRSGTDTTGGDTTTSDQDCFPNGWGLLNPIDWVEKPVKCALSWAFVPDQATVDGDTDLLKSDFNGSALGSVSSGVGDLLGGVTGLIGGVGDGDCEGPALPAVPQVGLVDESHPFDACSAPMSTWAEFCRDLLTFFVCLGGGYVALVVVAQAFGYHLPWRRIVPWYNNADNEQGELF